MDSICCVDDRLTCACGAAVSHPDDGMLAPGYRACDEAAHLAAAVAVAGPTAVVPGLAPAEQVALGRHAAQGVAGGTDRRR